MVNRTRQSRNAVQRLLREDYRERKLQLETLPERIATEKARLAGIRSAAEPRNGSVGGENSRQERDTAIIVELERLRREMEIAKREIALMDKIIASLTEEEQTALRIMDIEREQNARDILCATLRMEKSAAYNIYDNALDKFGTAYYGRR